MVPGPTCSCTFQIEIQCGDERSRNHIRSQQSLETGTTGHHGYDFRVACQLRCEEYDGNEDEQRREQVGKVGYKVGVIIENDSPERCVVGGEFCKILVDVENNGNADDKRDGVDVRANELLDDVPIKEFQKAERVQPSPVFLRFHLLQIHRLRPKSSITERFHWVKSPCSICMRASVTRRR